MTVRLAAFIRSTASRLQWLPPTVARITIGWIFVQSGWGKLHNLPQVISYFSDLGIPAPHIQAPFAAFMEFACGLLVLTGLMTRLASIPLAIIMVVAIVTAKKDEIGELSDLFALSEYLYIVLLAYLAAYGAGPLSIDWLLAHRAAGPGRRA